MKPTIYCPHCKGILNHHTPPTCPNCGKATGTDGPPVEPTWTAENVTEPIEAAAARFCEEVINLGTDVGKSTTINTTTTEHFTTDQMISAIGQWLAFGEQMFNDGNQDGHFSGAGWAARALEAAREFIENTNEPEQDDLK